MKNSIILILTIVIGGTIGLFWLLGPEVKTNLFYFNLGFTIFLEVLFFGAIFTVSGKKLFNVPGMATGVQITRYVMFAAIIMIAFNLINVFYADIMLYVKWYFGVLILLTIIYAIVLIFTFQGGQYQLKMNEEIKESSKITANVNLNHQEIINLFNNKTKDLEVDYSILKECKNNLRLIGDKASMISSSVINNNLSSIHLITNEINELGDEINKIKMTAEKIENENLLKTISNQAKFISIKISELRN